MKNTRVIILSALLLSPQFSYAAVDDQEAVKVIVGEASNQGFKGMQAVGEVIRHKGSLKGFYGATEKHLSQASKKTWIMARRAWQASAHSNITKGANHFENIVDFGTPYWVRSCVYIKTIKDHEFYKCDRG